jgi:hypothetical protein
MPPVAPLPPHRFAAFRAFARSKTFPAGPEGAWPWRTAVWVAAHIAMALGAYGIVSVASDEERDEAALAWWLSMLETSEWVSASLRARRVGHIDPTFGVYGYPGGRPLEFDPGDTLEGDLPARLSAWGQNALTALYTNEPAPAAPPEPPKAAALRKALKDGKKTTWDAIVVEVCETCGVKVGTAGYSDVTLRHLATKLGLYRPPPRKRR